MTPMPPVRELTADERAAPRRGLQSADEFTARRPQALAAGTGDSGPAASGAAVGRSTRAVRDAIRAFRCGGPGFPTRPPPAAKAPALAWDRKHGVGLTGRRWSRPRAVGRPRGLWAPALSGVGQGRAAGGGA